MIRYKKQIYGILISLSGLCGTLSAREVTGDTLKYRISLTDKAATEYSLQHPERYLSVKAIERRHRQGLAVDSTDLPVCRAYVDAIRQCGVRIVTTGKWENFVTVACNDTALIDEIAELPFVRCTEKVWQGREKEEEREREKPETESVKTENPYGNAFGQTAITGAIRLHEAGYKGQGMTIAVIDAGFRNADRIRTMKNIRILGTRNFAKPGQSPYGGSAHGLFVLSCMAMNSPGVMIGTAPEASYWLLSSEDETSEYPVEQDYWATAIEFADSVGVDLVNTSLGYYTFDDASKNYRYRDLDGRQALISRQASKAAGKGMVVVCSAGNSGLLPWKKITPPADADQVITVGAVDRERVSAPFSSVGNTADGRVKPDVMAVGLNVEVMGEDGRLRRANGTSFASPAMCGTIACLWQACPELTAKEIIKQVLQAGDRADFPDNIYGYGIPDLWEAYVRYVATRSTTFNSPIDDEPNE